jgi:hypothetical protein
MISNCIVHVLVADIIEEVLIRNQESEQESEQESGISARNQSRISLRVNSVHPLSQDLNLVCGFQSVIILGDVRLTCTVLRVSLILLD